MYIVHAILGNQRSTGVHVDSCGSEKRGDEHGELGTFAVEVPQRSLREFCNLKWFSLKRGRVDNQKEVRLYRWDGVK